MGETLTRGEIEALMGTLARDFHGIRDRAYLDLLYRCGLRTNEARMLDLNDIDTERDPWTVRVRHPKAASLGAKPRSLGLDKVAQASMKEWIRQRHCTVTKCPALFVTTKGGRVDNSHYRRKLSLMRRDAGVTRRVHPHAMRHTFARTMNDDGVSMRVIQLALGHSSLATTAIYLQSLGDPEVIAATSTKEW